MFSEFRFPDSLRAFLGVRPMKFRCVPDQDLKLEIQSNPYRADTVAGRYVVFRELFQPARVLYKPDAAATCWLEVRPEDVGESGTVGGDFTVDTASLAPGRRVLLLNLRGHNGFWGGSLDYGLTNIVDVTAEPLLLLKTEALHENVSYGRENDSVFDEDAAGSEKREQQVSIRRGLIRVGPATQTFTNDPSAPADGPIKPVPESMLPAGRYRYQPGKVVRVGK
ncbi:hypothetical protein LJY25_13120 [Hymenobacter sp. BT175]|uniref:hypothetical protein n=1 Tax=Hymenobacter translucens TaxID=2886507 RepID=UPI001D0DDE0D|nr:hypothetical protein [Hymenobacter translucens]MCC2547390.1 hypothetical protein [Hymenobacter translucens]